MMGKCSWRLCALPRSSTSSTHISCQISNINGERMRGLNTCIPEARHHTRQASVEAFPTATLDGAYVHGPSFALACPSKAIFQPFSSVRLLLCLQSASSAVHHPVPYGTALLEASYPARCIIYHLLSYTFNPPLVRSVPAVLSLIRGPWALLFWEGATCTLWFGRDVLGGCIQVCMHNGGTRRELSGVDSRRKYA